ncbi:hypothetical protein EDB89DRAFT_2230475 [Lactarius sanguifluus]|nr:hypothetical protein EDB89DRAFT_2230475 [Lactarius sanguifluus]
MSRGPVALATLTALGAYYYYSLLELPLAVQDLGGRLGPLAGLLAQKRRRLRLPATRIRVVHARICRAGDEHVRVGVLEAGGYVPPGADPRIDWIIKSSLVRGDPTYDRDLKSVPQDGLGGRVVDETVARVLGGSSMISDLLWQRPSREEFDAWGTELGNRSHVVMDFCKFITPAVLRKWVYAEPIGDLLVKENAPGEDR